MKMKIIAMFHVKHKKYLANVSCETFIKNIKYKNRNKHSMDNLFKK